LSGAVYIHLLFIQELCQRVYAYALTLSYCPVSLFFSLALCLILGGMISFEAKLITHWLRHRAKNKNGKYIHFCVDI